MAHKDHGVKLATAPLFTGREPSIPKVGVEQLADDGSWRELASRYTIEFRAQAARPTSKIRREFSVPVDASAAKLRLAGRGVGQVAISYIGLTNGLDTRPAVDFRRKKILGQRAPKRGFPEPNARPNAIWAVV